MIGEKGADLIKELWLQEDVPRFERNAETSSPLPTPSPSTKAEETTTKKPSYKNSSKKLRRRVANSKKVNVLTNTTIA